MSEDDSKKSGIICLLLCFFFGIFGVHRFYVGKIKTGIVTLLTLGAIGLWPLIDLLMLLQNSFTDADGKILKVSI